MVWYNVGDILVLYSATLVSVLTSCPWNREVFEFKV